MEKILEYYKKFLALRKSEPCITKGEQSILFTDDANGLVIEERTLLEKKKVRSVVIIYHNGKETIELKEYVGKTNLLTGTNFDGKVKAYEIVVILTEGGKIG